VNRGAIDDARNTEQLQSTTTHEIYHVKSNKAVLRAIFTLVVYMIRFLPYAATRRLETIVSMPQVKLYRYSHLQLLAYGQQRHEIEGMW
jgi:hypothetical protein